MAVTKKERSALWSATILSVLALSQPLLGYAEETAEAAETVSNAYMDIAFGNQKNTKKLSTIQNQKGKESCKVSRKSEVELHSRLQVGGTYSYVSLQPHGHKTYHGNLGGIDASYEYRPANRFYGAATFSWMEGSTHNSTGKRSMLYFDAQERLGYTYATNNRMWRMSLFSGLGYRHNGQKHDPKQGHSVQFNYNQIYIPVGFLTNYDPCWWFGIGGDFTWMPQVYPTLAIVPLKGARWVTTCTFNNFYVEMPITFTLTRNKRYQIILNPFYQHWADGHTTAKASDGQTLGLPGNTYNFYGFDVNFGFCF